METASDFIAAILQSDDKNIISSILVQESVSDKFKILLSGKTAANDEIHEAKQLSAKGFDVIGGRIVACPRGLLISDESVISYEVFRTTKEGITLAKNAISVGLWIQNISVAYEIINALNAAQIWLNSSFGVTNEKTPFLTNGKEIVFNQEQGKQAAIEVAGNIQFQTSFQNEKFKTVVIPFGETFAN
jgi:hypothetical protein